MNELTRLVYQFNDPNHDQQVVCQQISQIPLENILNLFFDSYQTFKSDQVRRYNLSVFLNSFLRGFMNKCGENIDNYYNTIDCLLLEEQDSRIYRNLLHAVVNIVDGVGRDWSSHISTLFQICRNALESTDGKVEKICFTLDHFSTILAYYQKEFVCEEIFPFFNESVIPLTLRLADSLFQNRSDIYLSLSVVAYLLKLLVSLLSTEISIENINDVVYRLFTIYIQSFELQGDRHEVLELSDIITDSLIKLYDEAYCHFPDDIIVSLHSILVSYPFTSSKERAYRLLAVLFTSEDMNDNINIINFCMEYVKSKYVNGMSFTDFFQEISYIEKLSLIIEYKDEDVIFKVVFQVLSDITADDNVPCVLARLHIFNVYLMCIPTQIDINSKQILDILLSVMNNVDNMVVRCYCLEIIDNLIQSTEALDYNESFCMELIVFYQLQDEEIRNLVTSIYDTIFQKRTELFPISFIKSLLFEYVFPIISTSNDLTLSQYHISLISSIISYFMKSDFRIFYDQATEFFQTLFGESVISNTSVFYLFTSVLIHDVDHNSNMTNLMCDLLIKHIDVQHTLVCAKLIAKHKPDLFTLSEVNQMPKFYIGILVRFFLNPPENIDEEEMEELFTKSLDFFKYFIKCNPSQADNYLSFFDKIVEKMLDLESVSIMRSYLSYQIVLCKMGTKQVSEIIKIVDELYNGLTFDTIDMAEVCLGCYAKILKLANLDLNFYLYCVNEVAVKVIFRDVAFLNQSSGQFHYYLQIVECAHDILDIALQRNDIFDNVDFVSKFIQMFLSNVDNFCKKELYHTFCIFHHVVTYNSFKEIIRNDGTFLNYLFVCLENLQLNYHQNILILFKKMIIEDNEIYASISQNLITFCIKIITSEEQSKLYYKNILINSVGILVEIIKVAIRIDSNQAVNLFPYLFHKCNYIMPDHEEVAYILYSIADIIGDPTYYNIIFSCQNKTYMKNFFVGLIALFSSCNVYYNKVMSNTEYVTKYREIIRNLLCDEMLLRLFNESLIDEEKVLFNKRLGL